jgi:glycosyltransferase involved in cell wall biosynthesis
MKILWIPHAGWHIPQRAHLFCRALAERHEIHVTDWVADFSSPRDYLSRRYFRNFFYRRYIDGKITVHGIPRISPALFSPSLRKFNFSLFSRYVQKIIDANQIDVVVGTFVVPPPRAQRLIFDLFDDNVAYWRDYRHQSSYAREIEENEDAYLHRADCIIVVSSVLAELAVRKRNGITKNIVIIPNGVDLERFKLKDDGLLRHQLGLEGRKVIGFISAFGEFSGLLRLIEAFRVLSDPGAVLLLVGDGPQFEPAQRLAKKYGMTNVIFIGRVPFDEVPKYYKLIDIGVIPFDKTPFTDAACPIKLIEYSAAGKVVVATNLSEIGRMAFPNVVLVKDNPEALSAGIKQATKLHVSIPLQLADYDLPHLVSRCETILKGDLV